jgi:hypothetical protein
MPLTITYRGRGEYDVAVVDFRVGDCGDVNPSRGVAASGETILSEAKVKANVQCGSGRHSD